MIALASSMAGAAAGASATALYLADGYMPGTIGILTAFFLLLMAGHVATFMAFCVRRNSK